MGKAKDFKAIADTAEKSTIDALLNIAINGAQAAAKKNLYSVSYIYPKHQAEALKPLLEAQGFNVISSNEVVDTKIEGTQVTNYIGIGITLTIDFSAPHE